MLSVLPILLACGGDDGGGAPGSNAAKQYGPSPGVDYRTETTVAEPLRSQLFDIADRIAADVCTFSETCCPHFGYTPRPDCTRIADELFFDAQIGAARGTGGQLDPQWAERCVERVHALASTCVFHEFEWARACNEAVRHVDSSGVPDPQCMYDEDCVRLAGEGHACNDGRCVPHAIVGEGADCAPQPGAASVPACAEGLLCANEEGSMRCIPRTAEGAQCNGHLECLDGLFCDRPSGELWTCAPALALGASCTDDLQCQSGICDVELGRVCVERSSRLRIGDPCTDGNRCPGLVGRCVNGVCQGELFAFLYCAPQSVMEAFGDGPMSTESPSGARAEDIPGSTRLTELDGAQVAALCAWSMQVADAALSCNDAPVPSTGCVQPSDPACVATVDQFRACFPAFVARADACRFSEQVQSGELLAIFDSTPECAGMGPCVVVTGL